MILFLKYHYFFLQYHEFLLKCNTFREQYFNFALKISDVALILHHCDYCIVFYCIFSVNLKLREVFVLPLRCKHLE